MTPAMQDYAPAMMGLAQPEPAERTEDALAEKRRKFRAYETSKRDEMNEGQEARRYYYSKQWTDTERARLKRRGQPVVTSNRVRRKVDFLVGVEQRMRRDPKAYPRNPRDEQSAAAASAAIRFVCDLNRWEHIASDVAHDGLVSGIGVAWIAIEPFRGSYEVKMKLIAVDRFFYDPRSVKPDFSDARYMGIHLWLDIDEAKELWPDKASSLASLVAGRDSISGTKSEEDRATSWSDFEHSRVRVVEFWEKRGKNWYYCKFSGEIELESGDSPYVDEDGVNCCPYVAWSPYVDEKGDRHGVVRDMKSIQDEINHRRSKFLHMLNVRQVHVRRGAVDDIDKVRTELSRPDGVIEHDGTKWGEDVGLIDQSDQVRGQAELLTEAKAELENLGPNPGLIGRGGGIADQSGRAILAQRDSGMTELSPVFDRLRDWKLRCYRAVWVRVKQAWTGERWIRVTDNDKTKFLGINQYAMDPYGQIGGPNGEQGGQNVVAEIDVDIILDEGPDSITMQEEEFDQLAKMAQAGIPIPPSVIIKASSLRNKDALLEELQQKPDPKQDMEIATGKADIDYKRAQTIKTLAEADGLNAQYGDLGMQSQPVIMPPIMDPRMMMGGMNGMNGMDGQQGGPIGPPPPDQMPPGMNGMGGPQEQIGPEAMAPEGALPVNPNAF